MNCEGGGGEGVGESEDFFDLKNVFEVEIRKNSLGLGFSVTGGSSANASFPEDNPHGSLEHHSQLWTNFIRVKKVFPLQPAWQTGKVKVGDILCVYTKIESVGHTSIDIQVEAWVQRDRSRNTVKVTEARFKFVALGIDGRPRQVT